MSEVSALPRHTPTAQQKDISTLLKRGLIFFVATRFAAIMTVASVSLAGCAGVPIAKTNCWATTGSSVTTSTKGASPDAGLVSRGNTSGLDVIPCQ